MKNNRGVTLIALITTIIVLIILSGVMITGIKGDKSIVGKSKDANLEARAASVEEAKDLWKLKNQETGIVKTLEKLVNELLEEKLITEQEAADILGETHTVQIGSRRIKFTAPEEGTDSENNGGGTTPNPPKPTLPSTADTTPFLPEGAVQVPGTNLNNGLVIKDAVENEWVWVEVPRSIYPKTVTNTDYENIEKAMKNYAKDYRGKETFDDVWYEQCSHGFADATAYNKQKREMLKSVYDNGGFYVGRYETGTNGPRGYSSTELVEPVIKKRAYPYFNITEEDAQKLSKMLVTGGRTCNLMYGIQWDLMLKHIENKKGKTLEELKKNSGSWGNYSGIKFEVTGVEYAEYAGSEFKPVSGTTGGVLLTTGATERNSAMNIYDLAGNLSEWTLESEVGAYYPAPTFRGGCYLNGMNSVERNNYITAQRMYYDIGFRPTMY